MVRAERREEPPLVHLGWLAIHDGHDPALEESYRLAAGLLRDCLQNQFPQFAFRVDTLTRRRYAARGLMDPVDLLEIGLYEKTFHRWDYALVATPTELLAREKAFTLGAPSSALETAVMSSLWFRDPERKPDQLAALGLYFLGHMWGLPVLNEGVMAPRETVESWSILPFTERERSIITERLVEVSDARLEDRAPGCSRFAFVWRAFWADPKSILRDIVGYRPWKQPFQLGGLTAAAFVTTLFLFFGAESWELGVHSRPLFLGVGAVLSVAGASAYLYRGQNLGQLARSERLIEQLERSRLILFCCLCLGMATLWVLLFLGALAIALTLPREVMSNWLDMDVRVGHLCHFAAFAAIIGVAAAALGGNLEDEGAMKAKFFFDEES